MRYKHLVTTIALLMTLGLAACGATTQAQPAAPADDQPVQIPEVAIEITDDGITAPAQMPAGIVAVKYTNASTQYQEGGVVLVKLNEGVTYEDIKALVAGDSPDSYAEFYRMVSSLGGGDRSIYNLTPDQYLAYFNGNVEGAPPISSPITVKDEGNTAAAPTADVTAEMKDGSFVLPAEIKAGNHLWQISNTGQQIHHILITKLPEGVTVDDIIAWVNEEVPSGPPPFLNPDGSVTGSGYEALSPGQSAWTEIDLPVGQYTVFDLLPDMSAQPPVSHITEGMHQTLTVVAGD